MHGVLCGIVGIIQANKFKISTHSCLEERLEAANRLMTLDPHCDVVVDTMADEANKAYAALPDRMYIILDGIVVFEGKRGPEGYAVKDGEAWLNNYFRA